MSTRGNGHAVVVGTSTAGLLTARALGERFDEVTVIERDRLPEQPELRRGIPHARHLHRWRDASPGRLTHRVMDRVLAAAATTPTATWRSSACST